MIRYTFIVVCLILILFQKELNACKGCIELDELSFEKVVKAFPASLVKFDIAFPYGEKHEIYESFSKDVSGSNQILVAQVGVKDYGDHDNEKLAEKYDIKKEDFPVLLLFNNGDLEKPLRFSDQSYTLENIKRFFKMNSDVYLGSAGCIEEFDKLVPEFVKDEERRMELKKRAEELLKKQNTQNLPSAKTYTIIMGKIIQNGENFIVTEQKRINKLLKEKLSASKKEELQHKLNIIDSFSKVLLRDEL